MNEKAEKKWYKNPWVIGISIILFFLAIGGGNKTETQNAAGQPTDVKATSIVNTPEPAPAIETASPSPSPSSSPKIVESQSQPAATAPAKPSNNCNPNYSPCVPNVSYDLDCADIGFTVNVIGSDPYRLDRDHDGYGCESY